MSKSHKAVWLSDLRSLGVFGRAWAVGILLFSVARALITWPTLSTYGVNPWTFLAIDVVTAIPYGIGQALTVKVLRDPTRPATDSIGWAVLVAVMFLAPYVYVVAASGENLPPAAFALVGAWAVVFGTLAVLKMRKQVRSPEDVAPG
jgi:hypothetical protein